jgi:hypothetical protein
VEQDAALVSNWIQAERERASRPSLEIAR